MFIQYIALFFFILYLISDGGLHISREYLRWMFVVLGFFSLSVLWALDWKVAAYKIVTGVMPVFIASIATFNYLKRTNNGIRKVLWVFLVVLGLLLLYVMLNIGDIRAMAEGARIGGIVSENAGVDDTEAKFNSNMIGMNFCYALFAGYVLVFRKKKSFIVKIFSFAFAALIVYLILQFQ